MKRRYSVLTLTCLVTVFTFFVALTPGFAQSKTVIPPTTPAVDVKPADLPEKFNQLKVGMTEDQVKKLLGYPVTIIPNGGDKKREWKYYFPGGVARLYVNFEANKIVSIQKRTP